MKVKVAIVGCGGIGYWHFNRLKDFDDVELVGFCDILPERAEGMAAAYGRGKAYIDVVAMYDETSPNAVYICVPPAEHGLIEFEAIKRGIHFLVQKPIGLDMSMITKIRDEAEAAGIVTSVGFQDRYLDIGEDIKNFIDDRDIGLITGAWVGGIPGVPWWRKKATSGGQLVEQNIHLFDMLRYFIGEPASVCAFSGKGIVKPGPALEGYDVDDYSGTIVQFKNGTVANILTGDYLTTGGHVTNGLIFYAADATIEYKLRESVTLKTVKNGRTESVTAYTHVDQGIALDRTFIDAVKTGDKSAIRSSYADAVKSMAFTLACNESMESGRVVPLSC